MRRWPATMAGPSAAKSSVSPFCAGTIATEPSPCTVNRASTAGVVNALPAAPTAVARRAGSTASARPRPSGCRVVMSAAATCSGVRVIVTAPCTISYGALEHRLRLVRDVLHVGVAEHRRHRFCRQRNGRAPARRELCFERRDRGGGIDGRPGRRRDRHDVRALEGHVARSESGDVLVLPLLGASSRPRRGSSARASERPHLPRGVRRAIVRSPTRSDRAGPRHSPRLLSPLRRPSGRCRPG